MIILLNDLYPKSSQLAHRLFQSRAPCIQTPPPHRMHASPPPPFPVCSSCIYTFQHSSQETTPLHLCSTNETKLLQFCANFQFFWFASLAACFHVSLMRKKQVKSEFFSHWQLLESVYLLRHPHQTYRAEKVTYFKTGRFLFYNLVGSRSIDYY